MNENGIVYRRLNSHEEYLACEHLQKETWGFADVSIVPGHILITFQKRGGLVLGAFEGDRLVGFVYGVSTIGNVLGTLVTTFMLVPAFGSRALTLAFAAVTFACGVVMILTERFLRGAKA